MPVMQHYSSIVGHPMTHRPGSEPSQEEPGSFDLLSPGTKVEVRRRFDAAWSSGFEVITADVDGYRLRRLSDGTEIPVPFDAVDVRRARRRNMWWI